MIDLFVLPLRLAHDRGLSPATVMNTFNSPFSRIALPVICLIAAAVISATAQTYVVSSSTGASPYTNIRPDAVLLMSDPADDSLTAWQTLPFTWSFFGQEVTGYHASDNGYITFDAAESVSSPRNSSLPSPTAPRNAIFAFWDSLRLAADAGIWSNEIRSKTFGTAPSRVHVIMWVSVTPSNVAGSGSLSFALAIHEGGDFEIIQVAGRPGGRTTGTIGAQNQEATAAAMLPGSPNFPYPSLTASADDDIVYHFTWPAERRNGAMALLDIPPVVRIGIPIRPSGRILNAGFDTITTISVHCRVGGGEVWTTTLNGLTLKGNESVAWSMNEHWTPDDPGSLTPVTAWLELDGDEKSLDDTLTAVVLTNLGETTARRPLVEEFTGAWCGWCPDGALQMDSIAQTLPEAVLVSIHAGTQPDLMKSIIGLELADAYLPAFPQAMIDRHLFNGETKIPLNRTDFAWWTRAESRIAEGAPFFLTLTPSYEPTTRHITAMLAITCADFVVPHDYRVHLLVVEDEVTGSGQGFDQVNYFSNNRDYPNHPFHALPNPVPNYVHRHVLRGTLTETWGDSGRVPSRMEAEQTYSISIEGTLGQDVDPGKARLVAFISRYGRLMAQRDVINATEASLIPASVDVGESVADGLIVIPTPTRGRVDLRYRLNAPAAVGGELIDMTGRRVALIGNRTAEPGANSISLDIPSLAPGVYVARLRAGTRTMVGRVVVY